MTREGTFKGEGHRIKYENTGSAIAAGDVVPMLYSCGIAVTDIAATTGSGMLDTEGVFELPAVSNDAFTQDEILYWDDDEGNVSALNSGSNVKIGYAFKAKTQVATTCQVKLSH